MGSTVYWSASAAIKRDNVTRFFASGFFHESPSPKPLKITVGSFRIFLKFAEIFASQGAPPAANFATGSPCAVDTGGKCVCSDKVSTVSLLV
jgi:hypothetical protein